MRTFLSCSFLALAACVPVSLDDGAPRPDGGEDTPLPPGAGCLAASLLEPLGRPHLVIGASMSDAVAGAAPFGLRYEYLAGGLFDGDDACASCTSGCTSAGASCAGGGCGWWGCWQDTSKPPGDYVRRFIGRAADQGQLPMVTYYLLLHGSGVDEGADEVAAVADAAFMRRYYADFRFFLKQLGATPTLVHLEPDLWGYAQQENGDPTELPAAVASANPTDCASQPNTFAGFGRCLVAMVRKYAPQSKVGFHASGWGPGIDALSNSDDLVDIAAEARALGTFLLGLGAGEGDFVGVEASDRDAGYYQSIGRDTWWDETNQALPHFHQAFTWAKALAEQVNRPLVWWQLPVGNMGLPNVSGKWKDNRVEYFFSHLSEVVGAHGAAVAFGAGAQGQTTPETDDGFLVTRVKQYAAQPIASCAP